MPKRKAARLFEKVDDAWAVLNELHRRMDEGDITEEQIRFDLGMYIADIEKALDGVTELVGMLVESY